METISVEPSDTIRRVKRVVRESLKLGEGVEVGDTMSLIGGEYDLDSLDILLVISSVEKEFAIKIPNEAVGREAFSSVATLARFVDSQRG